MRRRISVLVATMLAAGTFAVLGPSQPASAWVLCGGTGNATIGDPGILYPVGVTTPLTTPKTPGSVLEVLIGQGNPEYPFGFNLDLGACVHTNGTTPGTNTVTATGTVKGYCGLSSGRGITDAGDLFAWIGVGGNLILTGHLVGTVNATPDALAGQSCTYHTTRDLPTGAKRFIVTGAVAILNCTGDLQTLVPGTPNDHESLTPRLTTQFLTPIPLVHVLIDVGTHYYWNHQCFGNPVL